MEKHLKLPLYWYKSAAEAKSLTDWRYVCLQPAEDSDSDAAAELLGRTCNWGCNNIQGFFQHLYESHNFPYAFRPDIDFCCGQIITLKMQGILHYMNHALRFENCKPYINDGAVDENYKYVLLRLQTETRILAEMMNKNLPMKKRKSHGKDDNKSAKMMKLRTEL